MPQMMHNMHLNGGTAMNEPKGIDLLATLIQLLADQEGVKITCELTDGKDDNNVQRVYAAPV